MTTNLKVLIVDDNSLITVVKKHSLAIRWLHWINFPLIMLMIWSGLLIYWANRVYIPISDEFAEKLHLDGRLAEGMGWHFMLMWFFTINGFLYVIYLIFSSEWRSIIPNQKSIIQAIQVFLYDFKFTKKKPFLNEKFNGAQKIAYSLILLNGCFAFLTGIAIYKPVQLEILTTILGGYQAARFEHFVSMCIFIIFFLIHLIQVLRAGWNNFRSMITGYEIIAESNEDRSSSKDLK